MTDLPSAFWDVLPTLCDIAGAKTPTGIDGLSFLPTLTDMGKQQKHEFLYWEFVSYGDQAAVRMGDWKIILTHLKNKKKNTTVELYNMKTDPDETTNVADKYPDKVTQAIAIMKNVRTPSKLFQFPELIEFLNNYKTF